MRNQNVSEYRAYPARQLIQPLNSPAQTFVMRSEDRDPADLWDMLQAIRAIEEFTKDRELGDFLAPDRDREKVRLAVERKLEILGEAARQPERRRPSQI
jgi:hypothetical protein